jgi:hypothetical protein
MGVAVLTLVAASGCRPATATPGRTDQAARPVAVSKQSGR